MPPLTLRKIWNPSSLLALSVHWKEIEFAVTAVVPVTGSAADTVIAYPVTSDAPAAT